MLEEQDEGALVFLRVCAVYGTMPWVLVAGSLLEFFIRRGTRELNFLGFVCFVTLLNELIFKNIVKQMRPERSCLVSCGMPSGHATMAIGLLTVCLLDTLRRVVYRPNPLIISRVMGGVGSRCRALPRFFCAELCLLCTTSTMASWDELSHFTALSYSALWFLLLYPVPLSRVALYDHTPEQVFMGSSLGFLEACVWWYMIQALQHRFNHKLGCAVLTLRGRALVRHNFALPRFVAEQRVLAPGCSADAAAELQWYEARTTERKRAVEALLGPRTTSATTVRRRRLEEEGKYLDERLERLQHLRATATATA